MFPDLAEDPELCDKKGAEAEKARGLWLAHPILHPPHLFAIQQKGLYCVSTHLLIPTTPIRGIQMKLCYITFE